jgi:hypothetical protein
MPYPAMRWTVMKTALSGVPPAVRAKKPVTNSARMKTSRSVFAHANLTMVFGHRPLV